MQIGYPFIYFPHLMRFLIRSAVKSLPMLNQLSPRPDPTCIAMMLSSVAIGHPPWPISVLIAYQSLHFSELIAMILSFLERPYCLRKSFEAHLSAGRQFSLYLGQPQTSSTICYLLFAMHKSQGSETVIKFLESGRVTSYLSFRRAQSQSRRAQAQHVQKSLRYLHDQTSQYFYATPLAAIYNLKDEQTHTSCLLQMLEAEVSTRFFDNKTALPHPFNLSLVLYAKAAIDACNFFLISES